MKKLFLIVFFAAYYIFVPFVLINCSSQDLDYVAEPSVSTESGDDMALEVCLSEEFLTEECVDFVQSMEETAQTQVEAIRAAYAKIPDFLDCELIETATTSTDEETTTADATAEDTTSDEDNTADATDSVETEDKTTTTADAGSESDTEDATAAAEIAKCQANIETLYEGYTACQTLTTASWTYTCDEIQSTVDEASQNCDSGATTVTSQFCSLFG